MRRRLVYLERDSLGVTREVLFNGQRRDAVPYWETTTQHRRQVATALSQYFLALNNQNAREDLKLLEKWYGFTRLTEACERAWKIKGLDAMQTVTEVRRDLAERLYPMGRLC